MSSWRNYKPNPTPVKRSVGGMNKTEEAYAEYLELLKRAGEIHAYRFEAMKIRLAKRTFYMPDFRVVILLDSAYGFNLQPLYKTEFHEVKGFWRDDARVKIKVAAEM